VAAGLVFAGAGVDFGDEQAAATSTSNRRRIVRTLTRTAGWREREPGQLCRAVDGDE